MRKKFEGNLKAKVSLEAYKGEKTLGQISSEYGVHPNQIGRWRQELLKGVGGIFGRGVIKGEKKREELVENLYKNIGKLKVENDWLKKKLQLLD